ncbi:ATP-grasp domain-containing protein [Planctomycetaceae bacterium SH139]
MSVPKARFPALALKMPVPLDESAAWILIFGASVRAASEAAAKAGYRVLAVDQFGDQDARRWAKFWAPLDPVDPASSLLSAIELCRCKFPDCPSSSNLTAIACGGLESWFERLEPLRKSLNLLLPSTPELRQLRDPRLLQQLTKVTSARFPPTRFTRPPTPPPNTAESQTRWLTKQIRSSAGLGVRFDVEASRPGQGDIADSAANAPRDRYWQQQISGRAVGVNLLCGPTGVRILNTCRAINYSQPARASQPASPFLYGGSLGPYPLQPHERAAILEFADQLTRQVDFVGLLGSDWLLSRDGTPPWLLELNPRYTASMEIWERLCASSLVDVQLASYQLNDQQLDTMAFDFPENNSSGWPSKPSKTVIKFVLWAPRELFFSSNQLTSWAQHCELELDSVQWCDLPVEGTVIPAASPIVTAIVQLPDSSNAGKSAWRVLRKLKRLQASLRTKPQTEESSG